MRNVLPGGVVRHFSDRRPEREGSLAWLARSAVSLLFLAGVVWLMLTSIAGRS